MLLGYSLNNLSLMALTISTGFVVDDAIVMIENIARLIEEGDTALRRRPQGREADRLHRIVSLTVSWWRCSSRSSSWAASLAGCSASSPSPCAVAIGVSALLSLTLTPMMCAYLLRPEPKEHERGGPVPAPSERGFEESLIAFYDVGLRFVLRHKLATLVGDPSAHARAHGSDGLVPSPKGFFPQQDTGADPWASLGRVARRSPSRR